MVSIRLIIIIISDSVYSVWKSERMNHLHLKPCVKQLLDGLATHFNIGLVTNGKYRKYESASVRSVLPWNYIYVIAVVASYDKNLPLVAETYL